MSVSMGEPGSSAAGPSTSGKCSGASGTLDPDLSAMTADELKQFIDTGRTGRRNALPDVSEQGAISTSTAGMAEAMNSLSFQSGSDDGSNEAGSSSSSSQGKSS